MSDLVSLVERDARDRITAYQKSYNPGSNPLENGRGDRFRYDEEGQLVEAWYNATDPANSGANNTRYDGFGYDALGNRTQNNYVASRGQTSFVRRDNGLNQYSSWSPSVIYHDDSYPGWSPPGNGVTMTDGWITASYNALNQPVAVWSFAYQGTSNFMWFGYDPLGRCVKRWVGDSGDIYSNPATYFHYDGWNLLQEGANAWGPARVYVHGNHIDEIVWSYNTFTGEQAFHHYDARGHCTLLTDSTGGILEQYEYDAFGQPYFYDATGTSIGSYDLFNHWQGYSLFGNRFLFTGREWLADVRLYDYRNRLYQPELGRFLQPDPKHFTAGDYNLYRYCHNDPVNRSDPMGLDSGERMSPKDLVRLREITFKVPLGSNIKQWVTTGSVTMTMGLFTRLADAMLKDHADRTQTVYKNGSHSGIEKGHLLANNSHGVFERSRRQEFIPYDGHSDVAVFLHVHSVWNGSTPFPNPAEDWATVKSWQRPMLFTSEPLYGKGIGFLISPNGKHDPSETAVDLNR